MRDAFDDLSPAEAVSEPSRAFSRSVLDRIRRIEARAERRHARRWHLAQLNLGTFNAPLNAPELAEFVAALDRINAIADESPGFIWRLKGDDGGPSSFVDVPGSTDPLLASNLSVWTDLESLRGFMYRTDHGAYLRRKREWFQHMPAVATVLWWVPEGTIPTLEEAMERLEQLRADGPSDRGWPLSRPRPAPNHPPSTRNQEFAMIPYLTVGDARAAIDFYTEVFAAEQSGELFEMDDGRIGHAELSFGRQRLYLADEFPSMGLISPTTQGSNSMSLVIDVDDCAAVYDHALAAGATGERPPSNQHGQRNAWFKDPWGHRWCPTSDLPADS